MSITIDVFCFTVTVYHRHRILYRYSMVFLILPEQRLFATRLFILNVFFFYFVLNVKRFEND